MPEKLILVLYTTHQTMMVEKILKENKIVHTLVSKPPKVNPGCGMAVCFLKEDKEKVEKLLQDTNFDYEGIYSDKEEETGQGRL